MTTLQIGDKVPHFENKNENGEEISSTSLLGKKYILFFYPKDDSPGCTKQACGIRDNYKAIKKLGYEIYGISPDKEKKHKKFIDKYEFQFSLLADTEKETIEAFKVWGPKQFMGKEIVGVYRTTFVVDEDGKIIDILSKIRTKDHGNELLARIEEIEKGQEASSN